MMKKNLMFLALATIGLASCNGGFKKAPGGLLYNINVDKGGPKIKEGDFMAVDVVAKTDGDSVLFSSYEQGSPSFQVLRKSAQPGDVMNVFQYLSEGDSATVKTNIDSLFKKGSRRPPIKGKYIIYQVKVEKVIAKGNKPNDTSFNAAIKKYMDGQSALMKKAEVAKLKKYIDDNKLVGTTTPSGLFYTITTPGVGDKPAVGDTAEVYYTAKFTGGKVFETNVKATAQKTKNYNPGLPYKPIRVPVGVKRVIPGWDEGLMLLNKGAKATFVIPSKLAYGEQGYAIIPPYTPLVFEVEMVDIIHPDPNAPKPIAAAPMTLQQLQHKATPPKAK